MKYVRTKDGRIIEESKLEPGLKQTCITLIRKRDNKTLTQIICDDMDEYVEMIVVGEYCKCHKINPKEIRYERIVLLNETLKQSDTIEDLIQIGDIVFYWSSSDDKEHCCLMACDTDIVVIKSNVITKLLIPIRDDYKCVARGYPSFNLVKGKHYLVNKGKLELL